MKTRSGSSFCHILPSPMPIINNFREYMLPQERFVASWKYSDEIFYTSRNGICYLKNDDLCLLPQGEVFITSTKYSLLHEKCSLSERKHFVTSREIFVTHADILAILGNVRYPKMKFLTSKMIYVRDIRVHIRHLTQNIRDLKGNIRYIKDNISGLKIIYDGNRRWNIRHLRKKYFPLHRKY